MSKPDPRKIAHLEGDLGLDDASAVRAKIDELNAELATVQQEKDSLRDQAIEVGMRARDIADEIARLEQQHGDEQAIQALRERGGVEGAMAARGIAVTMPDSDRAARFESLSRELRGDQG